MNKYQKIMSKVKVTPQMKEKILTQVERSRNSVDQNDAGQKNRKIILLKRWIPACAAACLAIVIGLFIPKINRVSSSKSVSMENYTVGNAQTDEAAEEVQQDTAIYTGSSSLLFVDATLYVQTNDQASYSESDKDMEYVGEVSAVSDADKEPDRQLEASTDIIGAKVYRLGNDLVVFYKGSCLLFEPLSDGTY